MESSGFLLVVPLAPALGIVGLLAAGRLEERTWRKFREASQEDPTPDAGQKDPRRLPRDSDACCSVCRRSRRTGAA